MNEVDEDNNGNIDFYEFVTIMEKYERLKELDNEREKRRIAKEKEEIKQKEMEQGKQGMYNNKLNTNLSGNYASKSLEEKTNDPLLNAFRHFDRKKDGYISCQEFKFILQKLGDFEKQFSDKEIEILYRTCQLKDNGRIYYEDFIKKWRLTKGNNPSISVEKVSKEKLDKNSKKPSVIIEKEVIVKEKSSERNKKPSHLVEEALKEKASPSKGNISSKSPTKHKEDTLKPKLSLQI